MSEIIDQAKLSNKLLGDCRAFLEVLDLDVVISWLAGELPQVVGCVMGLMAPETGAKVLARLPEELRTQTVSDMASMRPVDVQTIQVVHSHLKDLFDRQSKKTTKRGGVDAVAVLLQGADPQLRANILEKLDLANPAMAGTIRRSILTVAQIANLLKRDLQKVCGKFNDCDLALILKTENLEVQKAYLECVSKTRQERIMEEWESRPPVRKVEHDSLVARFIETVVEMKNQGLIVFPWEEQLVS